MTASVRLSAWSGEIDPAVAELVEDLANRVQAGEALDVEAVVAAHPEHAAQLRRLLPALEVLADLGRSASASDSAPPRLASDDEPAPGVLGDFRLVREIGRGGMGVVYEAEQLSLGRRVALKVLPLAATLDPKQLHRFKQEAQAAAHLLHQNIVAVHAVGCERGVHFYAMQLIEGVTVAALITELRRQRGLPAAAPPEADTPPAAVLSTRGSTALPAFFDAVANLGLQAAEALEHAHQMGVLHRDVKPANLMVDGRVHLWVTDFGLARVHGEAGLTVTGDVVGTLRYMSPEQAAARPGLVDQRSDVYSLGVTLYEFLTLEPAFAGNDRQDLLRRVATEEPPPPRRWNPAIPKDLETIVLAAMAREPAERYATAQELADDLRRFLEDKPVRGAGRP